MAFNSNNYGNCFTTGILLSKQNIKQDKQSSGRIFFIYIKKNQAIVWFHVGTEQLLYTLYYLRFKILKWQQPKGRLSTLLECFAFSVLQYIFGRLFRLHWDWILSSEFYKNLSGKDIILIHLKWVLPWLIQPFMQTQATILNIFYFMRHFGKLTTGKSVTELRNCSSSF